MTAAGFWLCGGRDLTCSSSLSRLQCIDEQLRGELQQVMYAFFTSVLGDFQVSADADALTRNLVTVRYVTHKWREVDYLFLLRLGIAQKLSAALTSHRVAFGLGAVFNMDSVRLVRRHTEPRALHGV